eukprot:Sspe_Gene.41698::Locus_20179_Transcript_1_1_Confidence_1.000_Length_1296::g.41698::m.41698
MAMLWKGAQRLTEKGKRKLGGSLYGAKPGDTRNESFGRRHVSRQAQGPDEVIEEEMGEFGGGSATASEGSGDSSFRTFKGHEAAVYGCVFSPCTTRILTGGRDRTMRVWTFEDGDLMKEPAVRTIRGNYGIVLVSDFSPTGREVVWGSDDGNVYIFEAVSTKHLLTLKGHTNKVYGAVYTPMGSTSPGEYLATVSLDRTVRLWSAETGQEEGVMKGHTDNIFACRYATDGRVLATAGDDKGIIVWDWRTGKKAFVMTGHKSTVWSVSWNPTDTQLVSTSMGCEVKMWDIRMHTCSWTIEGAHSGLPIHQGIFSGDHVITCARDKRVAIWDAARPSKDTMTELRGHNGTVYHMDIHPLGNTLLTSSVDSTVKLWHLPDGTAETEGNADTAAGNDAP